MAATATDNQASSKMKRDVMKSAGAWERSFGWDEADAASGDRLNIQRTIQAIGGSVVAIALITVVVNEVLTTNAIANSTGPFTGVIDSLNTTGVAAMTLLVVGLLVAAGMRIMGMMGGGGGGF